ncbi:MAG: DUF1214 domain-containing protein [Rhizobiaceae bacterium]|jgi:hypothetical protein
MLRIVLPIFVALAIAIGGGAWSVHLALERGFGIETLSVGPWKAYPDFGTPDASPYAKAAVAQGGELPLGLAEGLAFEASDDSSGAALMRNCSYRITGDVPTARFWTLYATDGSMTPLPSTGIREAALQSGAVLHEADGSVIVTASPRPASGNWLPLAGSGRLMLILALYDTPIASSTEISRIVLPAISRLGCE